MAGLATESRALLSSHICLALLASSALPLSLQVEWKSPGPLLAGTDGLGRGGRRKMSCLGYLGGETTEGAFLREVHLASLM